MRCNANSTPYCSLCPRSAFGPLRMVVTPIRTGSAAKAELTVMAHPSANNADINLMHDSFAGGLSDNHSRTTPGKAIRLPERKKHIALCAHVDCHLAEMPPSLEILIGGRSFVEREDSVDGRGDLIDVDEADELLEHRTATGCNADQTLGSADKRARLDR